MHVPERLDVSRGLFGKQGHPVHDLVPIEKPKGEPGDNFQMFASMGAYTVEVATTSGTSDKVKGLGMGTPEHPGVKEHTSFLLKFRKL